MDPAPLILRGRCLPYGDGVTYWPLAEILKGHAGILDTDPPDLAVEKVRKTGRDLLTQEIAADPTRATAALAYTVGLDDPEVSFEGADLREVREELHRAWTSFFTALALAGPVIVVIEDIHWADPSLLDLLSEMAERVEGPVTFLCPARPDLTATRPDWGGGRRNMSSIALDPLSADDAEHLVRLLLTVDDLPPSVLARILERAEGNPFYLEEIVRRLIDGGLLERQGDRWIAAAGIEDVEIPDTVQAVLASRIDLLDPLDKRVLQAASVVGRVFWIGPLGELTDVDAASSSTRSGAWRIASWCSPDPDRRSPASANTSSSTSSRGTSRTSRCRAGTVPTRTPRRPDGSSARPANARPSSPSSSRTTTGPPSRWRARAGALPTMRCATPRGAG